MTRLNETESSIRTLAAEVASAAGVELYDLVLRRSGPRLKLQVFLHSPDRPIGLDDCERVSRQLSRELDVLDAINSSYDLEVSSPGLDRQLRTLGHWMTAKGEKVQARWRDEHRRAATIVATVVDVDPERLVLRGDDGLERIIPLGAIESARVHVEW